MQSFNTNIRAEQTQTNTSNIPAEFRVLIRGRGV